MKFNILNTFTGDVQFTADIVCPDDTPHGEKLGLAVRAALRAGADLCGADLSEANLRRANLGEANLGEANLGGANLSGQELIIAQTRILHDGDIVGWKKCQNKTIVKLLIPAGAKRSHAFGRKCRAEYADVLEVIGGDVGITSTFGPKTEYRVGTRVMPDSFDDDWTKECSNGIHFFVTRAEAEKY